ncbi:MAG: leucine-rich repeat domain-containing protein [Prevotella sp.]|nr:leucine-rich repeat domain-containing protein [Prevotella sp.]
MKNFLLIVCLIVPIISRAFSVNGINYTFPYSFEGNEVIVSIQYNCTETVVIPSTVTYLGATYQVIGIGNGAFRDCKSKLKSITISEGIRYIGQDAFAGCEILSSISFPASLSEIQERALQGCVALENISFSSKVVTIEENAFSDCIALRSIYSKGFLIMGNTACKGCVSLNKVKAERYISISNGTFDECTHLDSIINIKSVGYRGFSNNPYIKHIEFTDSIVWGENEIHTDEDVFMGSCAFQGCDNLQCVYTGGCQNIPQYAFSGCKSLQHVVTTDSLRGIENRAFEDCVSLRQFDIGKNLRYIGSYGDVASDVFFRCSSLTKMVIPDSTISIAAHAFSYCTALDTLIIGNSLAKIGSGAFLGCSSLKEIAFPSSLTIIGTQAFGNCTALESVLLPMTNPLELGRWVFWNCQSLRSITIGDNVNSIGEKSFYCCSNLKEVSLGKEIEIIGKEAFAYCHNLRDIRIPEKVRDIEEKAFYMCSRLEKVDLGENISYIGTCAFDECKKIGHVTSRADIPPYLEENAFCPLSSSARSLRAEVDANSRYLYVPQNSKDFYENSLWADFFTDIQEYSATSGIIKVINQGTTDSRNWYSLDGHLYKRTPSRKGVYIKNKKKVIVH